VGVKLKNKNINFAKNLRKNTTNTEKYLWKCLRGNQLEGFKFLRQQQI
jgi:very-short-patch-repair endonuclease